MSVDNSAIIFVGKYYLDIPQADDFEDSFDFLEYLYDKYPDLDEQSTNADKLIGYKIADSGSYGTVVLSSDICDRIKQQKVKFREIFGLEPEVYLFNYQY